MNSFLLPTWRVVYIPALVLLAGVGQTAFADNPVDDLGYTVQQALETSFAEAVGALVEQGKSLSPESLEKQLKEERHPELDLSGRAFPHGSIQEIYQQARKSVVMIGSVYKCGRCDHWHSKDATGFIIGRNGLIATNYHVLEKGDRDEGAGVRLFDGRVFAIEEVVASDRFSDLAVVRIQAEDLPALALAENVEIGEEILTISHPVGNFYTLSTGLVSNKVARRMRSGKLRREFTITADFAKGSSGGPILNRKGEVVGMVRATVSTYYDKEDGVNNNLQMVWKYCIPSFEISALGAGKEQPE